ncbi:hypothetical protein X747_24835 [Mesorhizobium sp. LNJC384A00]|nr:hypothetical protein X747_24835 [Mesorhizobium sp. LNJC384A00]
MLRLPESEKPAAYETRTGLEKSSASRPNDTSTDIKFKASAQRALDPKWRAQRAWNERNRHARRAHALVAQAIKKGELVRWACEECGAEPADFHHDPDRYHDALCGEFLCRKHHRQRHAAMRKQGGANG